MTGPSWKQGLVLFLAGGVLAVSACYGFFAIENFLFAIPFIAGVLMALIGATRFAIHASWKQLLVMLASGIAVGTLSVHWLEREILWSSAGIYLGVMLAAAAMAMVLERLFRFLFRNPRAKGAQR